MKKINITAQLTLIILLVIMVASLAFSFITLKASTTLAEKELYNRLSTYLLLINVDDDIKYTENITDLDVGIIIKDENGKIYNDNTAKYLTQQQIDEVILLFNNNNIKKKIQDKVTTKNETIYYVYLPKSDSDAYAMIFTDDEYINQVVKTVGFTTNITYFLVVLLAISTILFWSNKFVKRIKGIQNHIIDLPKNKYESTYVDNSLDEIGELSRSIEKMRLEISSNEKTKQEMLQNLSHDFKTPITVIKSYAEAEIDGMGDENTIKVILEQTEVLQKKVNRLLEYNSLEYLLKDKEFESVNINDIILDVLSNYKYEINVSIELDLEDNIYFDGYKDNWYTVIDNIIDNAKRYAKNKIKIVLKENRLRIYNDGEHIDKDFIESIFKPYEKGSKGQFGLGMSIAKKIVNFFDYNLTIVNDEVGVSFIINK